MKGLLMGIQLGLYSTVLLSAVHSWSRIDFAKLASFPKLICAAALFRMVWLVCVFSDLSPSVGCERGELLWVLRNALLFTGELAQICSLTAFSSIFFFWWDALLASGNRVCNLSLLQILLNLWVFVLWVSLFAYRLLRGKCNDGGAEQWEESEWEEELLLSGFFALLGLGFAIVGVGLARMLHTKPSSSGERMRFKIGAICLSAVPLFLTKSGLLLALALGSTPPAGGMWYPWLYFTLPEVLPALVCLYFLRRRDVDSIALEDAALLRGGEDASNDVWRL
ncbi:hypothetical protein BASA81_001037 [Batrachochytrium salamandrivorans]|nr:hypothetical protein BASA81_001037 [Batrachochytrium salamandrivorans]